MRFKARVTFACALAAAAACALEQGGIGTPADVPGDAGGGVDATVGLDGANESDGQVGDVDLLDVGLDAALDTDADASATDAPKDAPPDSADAQDPCSLACTKGTCVGGRCIVECNTANECTTNPCPAGFPCTVNCTVGNGCGTISCTDCNIKCSTGNACTGTLACSGAGCTISCCENNACQGSTACNGAGCNVACAKVNACNGSVSCNGAACDGGNVCQ